MGIYSTAKVIHEWKEKGSIFNFFQPAIHMVTCTIVKNMHLTLIVETMIKKGGIRTIGSIIIQNLCSYTES